jgi:hypothetical protein
VTEISEKDAAWPLLTVAAAGIPTR